MTHNESGIDRSVRIIVGLLLIGLTVSAQIGPWGWIGIVPLATGLIGWCPAYSLFGIKTSKTQ